MITLHPARKIISALIKSTSDCCLIKAVLQNLAATFEQINAVARSTRLDLPRRSSGSRRGLYLKCPEFGSASTNNLQIQSPVSRHRVTR
jgi:hypothetical protein